MGKLLNAVVKYPAGKILDTKYGEKVNAVFDCGGEEIKIWADANTQKAELLKSLTKGEQRLILDDNGKYKLLEDEQTAKTNGNGNSNGNGKANSNYEPMSDDKKRAIATYIKDMTGLYGFCLEQAKALDLEKDLELPPEAIKDVATTLFITSQRHFNL
ncbi:hypothetical protein [Planktothrix mougeotii]|uniref:Uncharacterized protein n=1 Tax=Planktothrix mougeotii LEGE 06226 TaxID=1828728 RepID=A0ABR9UH68_9CYAN|nr:hypothetical protein [Planktothrix mougeotii]MBE9144899.1 hypothetical protein [Planktothrix mougeotii LEGE 06226]